MLIAHTAMIALTRNFPNRGCSFSAAGPVVAVISRENGGYSSTVRAIINTFGIRQRDFFIGTSSGLFRNDSKVGE